MANDGGPAFPTVKDVWEYGARDVRHDAGMSLRDWFAGQFGAALAGQLFKYVHDADNADVLTANALKMVGAIPPVAYRLADAMIAQREKERS